MGYKHTAPVIAAFLFLTAPSPARGEAIDEALRCLRNFNFRAVRLAVEDLTTTFGKQYPNGREYLERLEILRKSTADALRSRSEDDTAQGARLVELARLLVRLREEALLSNPLLDFKKLVVVKRAYPIGSGVSAKSRVSPYYTDYGKGLGLPVNHYSFFSVDQTGYDNEIAILSPVHPDGELSTLFRPGGTRFVGDLEMHFDGSRMLFTTPFEDRWQVFEIRSDGTGLRRVTPADQADVDNYDAAYLPNGKIIFCSTANYQSVPCWNGLHNVAGIYSMNADGGNVRQLTFDQDDDGYPVVLNTGQVLINRWEYANTPHVFAHSLLMMNPDGTGQREFYGSNSYWPNAVYFARPIPGQPTRIIGIVSGHHGDSRMGELVILDPAKGRYEAEGVVQRIPGFGKRVEPVIRDRLVSASWPKFLHPYPLNEHFFLVAARPAPESNWGIYLVDVYDNMLLIREEEGYALLEPIPLRRTPAPPVISEKVDPSRKDGTVYLHDIYTGPGLAGVPRGLVKNLRVLAYHFGYRGVSGWSKVGIDGPWDVMRILGTVPVSEDGSAMFRVPANMPIAVQPLDEKGRALQVMRSWFTVMPGEVSSCVGCHERQNSVPVGRYAAAARRLPAEIQPWYGPARGFDFEREVQPVLDRYCVGCHDGKARTMPDLRALACHPDYKGLPVNVPAWWSENNPTGWVRDLMRSTERKKINVRFTPAYEALHPYVRRPGLESDYHLPFAGEYHASTSELIQMLEKGHHNVRLDREAWDRLFTWIDLNVPCHGTWGEILPIPFDGVKRRRELLKLYAHVDYDPEAVPDLARDPAIPVIPAPEAAARQDARCPGWPFGIQEARERQRAAAFPTERSIALGSGVSLKLTLIPAGEFLMGDPDGEIDERTLTRARIDRSFWMGVHEVTNEQYRLFDPGHDSGYINQLNTNVVLRGYPVNEPRQPVVRVSWNQAMEFCRWLSEKTGAQFTLPTEAQWEYACRAGTSTPFHYGTLNTVFAQWGNMADATLSRFAQDAKSRGPLYVSQPDWMLKIASVNDGALVTAPVGSYYPNPWDLYDMHGNAGEWTLSAYPGSPGREDNLERVVRGGSWFDRPKRCRSAFRLKYPQWQQVFNVGLRVICEVD